MCPPTYFDVSYSINPWMDPSVPVDRPLALRQWSALVETYRAAGHRVDLLDPVPGLPDMVYAANGALVVDGIVLPARFAYAEREAEADLHAAWHRRNGILLRRSGHRRAGCGQRGRGRLRRAVRARSSPATASVPRRAAHSELAALTGREVISLELVDPHLYHLDVALTVLDDERDHLAYYPAAFSPASRRLLAKTLPGRDHRHRDRRLSPSG